MGSKKSKGSSKKGNSKKNREKNNKANVSQNEEKESQKAKDAVYYETMIEGSAKDASDIKNDSSASKTSLDTNSETIPNDTTNINADINNYCEEIKAKQQELLDKIKSLSEGLISITLIRDNISSIRVDTLTELYFTRQVRPLLDALNIISFATSNMSNTATDFQTNAFADKKEIKNALNLSYKMNDEVDDIITALDRRLKIFINEINKMDKNCPPFEFNKDS